ncbi:hypothetical protein HYALB_00011506 [Hymenoscyphus albidus]|uniref:Uncharacterized protein n=1 Tax=Hymenoscyphus albidus TaxID=595503 RepID=A0A9N9LTA0_9HELO|nr:hypothetical protein HYALB_00011506 [Hymenoscyphus albidus]
MPRCIDEKRWDQPGQGAPIFGSMAGTAGLIFVSKFPNMFLPTAKQSEDPQRGEIVSSPAWRTHKAGNRNRIHLKPPAFIDPQCSLRHCRWVADERMFGFDDSTSMNACLVTGIPVPVHRIPMQRNTPILLYQYFKVSTCQSSAELYGSGSGSGHCKLRKRVQGLKHRATRDTAIAPT